MLQLLRGALRRIDTILTRWADPSPDVSPPPVAPAIEEFFRELAADAAAREYIQVHLPRLAQTMTLVPKPTGLRRALELGAYMQMTPALQMLCGYPEVRAADLGQLGRSVRKAVALKGGEFTIDIDLFDVERDRFPYPDAHFSLVLCCELLEHLLSDPIHMLLEIRRILEPGGRLLLTTPNCASLTSLASLLEGRSNPLVYSRYTREKTNDRPHVREYTAHEIEHLMSAAGFEIEHLSTERIAGRDEARWVRDLLIRNHFDYSLRGEQTYCLAVLNPALAVDRYPEWLYA
ncbi:MAG TPA: methyltransferase domain-containing protein [Bryobacteraceae bacterium]|nr:methyltransferase domain-containing protein [Bryobacteraceae bacterium]